MVLFEVDEWLYLIANLFRMYVLYRLIGVFFIKTHKGKYLEVLAFSFYYILNSGVSLYYGSPFIDLVLNLVLFFALTYIYEGKLSTRIIATVLIYSTGMLLESVIYNLFEPIIENNLKAFTNISCNVILFLLVLILERIYDENRVIRINRANWIAIFLIPVSSIIIVITAFISKYNSVSTIVNVSLLLGINVLVFYLYDVMIQHYNDKYEKELLLQQNKAYANQFELIKESNDNIRILRHDMKNHIYTMQYMLQNDKKQDLIHYLNRTYDYIDVSTEYINSGNADIDSILNYKIYEAKKIGASIDACVNISENIQIAAFDLNVIFGNLLDNAIDGLKKSKEKRLQIEITLDRSVLYISVTNTYNGIVDKKNEKFLTTKPEINNHGIGLSSVENVINKYNGTLDIDFNNETFMVNILLYNPTSGTNNESRN